MKKHNCQKSQQQFAEWLFADSLSLHLETSECQLCYEQYLTLKNVLEQHDQALRAALPPENYWSAYEAKLWTKLAAEKQASSRSIYFWQPRWLVPVAGCLLLILLAVLNQGGIKTDQNKISMEEAKLSIAPISEVETINNSTKPAPKKRRLERPNKPERKETVRPLSKKPQFLFDPNPVHARMDAEVFIAPETALTTRHFERAQLLLRAFRNSRLTETGYDLSYEKNRSRRLLYENILLRREAESRGDWSMEEVLNNLEPLLLDIANLPDRASADEVNLIKERVQKQEIVAKLQFFALPIAVTVAD